MRSAKRTRDLLHQGRALTESAILAPMTMRMNYEDNDHEDDDNDINND